MWLWAAADVEWTGPLRGGFGRLHRVRQTRHLLRGGARSSGCATAPLGALGTAWCYTGCRPRGSSTSYKSALSGANVRGTAEKVCGAPKPSVQSKNSSSESDGGEGGGGCDGTRTGRYCGAGGGATDAIVTNALPCVTPTPNVPRVRATSRRSGGWQCAAKHCRSRRCSHILLYSCSRAAASCEGWGVAASSRLTRPTTGCVQTPKSLNRGPTACSYDHHSPTPSPCLLCAELWDRYRCSP
jgi:hypothetical protein